MTEKVNVWGWFSKPECRAMDDGKTEVWNPKYGLACAREEVLCKKKV